MPELEDASTYGQSKTRTRVSKTIRRMQLPYPVEFFQRMTRYFRSHSLGEEILIGGDTLMSEYIWPNGCGALVWADQRPSRSECRY